MSVSGLDRFEGAYLNPFIGLGLIALDRDGLGDLAGCDCVDLERRDLASLWVPGVDRGHIELRGAVEDQESVDRDEVHADAVYRAEEIGNVEAVDGDRLVRAEHERFIRRNADAARRFARAPRECKLARDLDLLLGRIVNVDQRPVLPRRHRPAQGAPERAQGFYGVLEGGLSLRARPGPANAQPCPGKDETGEGSQGPHDEPR